LHRWWSGRVIWSYRRIFVEEGEQRALLCHVLTN
jgi:hypothetical protein